MRHAPSCIAVFVLLLATGGLARTQAPAPPSLEGWRTFEGEWSATGQISTLPTEGQHPAAVVRLSGALVLGPGQAMGRGFRGEYIGFDNGGEASVGRAVWTDELGDRVFSETKGGPVQTGRRFLGTITGGTGRYAGISGDYEFSWQYVVKGEDDVVQGRTVGLKGRFRRDRQ